MNGYIWYSSQFRKIGNSSCFLIKYSIVALVKLLYKSITQLFNAGSVQFSPVTSNSLWPHGLQHARPPCPSPNPGACSNSCLTSTWCHPTISSRSSPSPPAFSLSQHQGLFQWISFPHQVSKVLEFQLQHQSTLPMNTQDWFPLGLTGWISLQFKGLSRVFSNTTVQKHQFFNPQLSLFSNSHIRT